MLQPGTIISDRYEIIEEVGSGGMSIVYKARCTKLERFVAIKVLRDEFAHDEEFVKKFKVEAQSAASLSHANIVNIYDVGNDGSKYYFVMELLDGVTLKEYIKDKGPLPAEEVIRIGMEVASALEHAHSNHIIHRDIKPQNIMMTYDGKVKVADFGIAMVARGTTIQVQDVASGSVHYIPPEQAKGGITDVRSDIYSLGITLFEMTTGKVPFNGDTEVAIALKQINEEMPAPSSFIGEMDHNLEQIIMKTTQKKPDMRYASAAALLVDFRKAYAKAENDFVSMPQEFEDESQTIIMDGRQMRQIWSEDELLEDEKPILSRFVVIMGVFTAVLLVTLISLFVYKQFGGTILNRPVELPSVLNMTMEEAEAFLDEQGILFEVTASEYDENIAENRVMAQEPAAGSNIDKKTVVQLTLSKGAPEIQVPMLTGKSFTVALGLLQDAKLTAVQEKIFSSTVPIGLVIGQNPEAGDLVEEGTEVTITISLGEEMVLVTVPDVRNMPLEEAVAALEAAGLTVGENISESYHETVEEGNVIFMTVLPGEEVREGYEIDLTVSLGQEIKPVTKEMMVYDDVLGVKSSGVLKVVLRINGDTKVVFNQTVAREEFPMVFSFTETGSGEVEVYVDDVREFVNAIYFTAEE